MVDNPQSAARDEHGRDDGTRTRGHPAENRSRLAYNLNVPSNYHGQKSRAGISLNDNPTLSAREHVPQAKNGGCIAPMGSAG